MFIGILLRDLARTFRVLFEISRHCAFSNHFARGEKPVGSLRWLPVELLRNTLPKRELGKES